MIIRISIAREYDTEGEDHAHLFEGVEDPEKLALHLFAGDIYSLANAETIREGTMVEVYE